MLQKHPSKNPLRGNLGFLSTRCYKHCEEIRRNTQANKPYGTKEVFEVFKVSA